MKLLTTAAALGFFLWASAALAAETTIKGELVDTSCYMGHGAKGASHKKCALKCLKEGVPMAVLTDKDELILLLPNHDNEEPYNKAKDLAAETVDVKGDLVKKGGLTSIIVSSVSKIGK